jgi:hypothetical protein
MLAADLIESFYLMMYILKLSHLHVVDVIRKLLILEDLSFHNLTYLIFSKLCLELDVFKMRLYYFGVCEIET